MATSENVAFVRRVEALEKAANGLCLLWVRTTLVVYAREVEPEYTSLKEINRAAAREPRPTVLRREPDLELLIDPVARVRKLRHELSAEGQASFDEMKARAQLVDVEISCHEHQVGAVLSESPTTAAIGGNRAGKSMVLVFWLFRRWMLRGGPGRVFWWVSPSLQKRFAQGVYSIAGQKAQGGGRWPDALMTLPAKGIPTSARMPRIEMVDGSVVEFMHAAGDGGNLKSENVVDIVLDELGEIDDVDNFHQAKIRVSQTGGGVAAATTRKRGHWMDEEITKRAAEDGPDVVYLTEFDLFDSPWMSFARILRLFVNDKTLTKRQLEEQVLPAEDKRGVVFELAKHNAKSMREHFGVETAGARRMWVRWDSSLIYRSDQHQHPHLFITRAGEEITLLNITEMVMRSEWPVQTKAGKRYARFAGCDFNVRGHAVIMELFGEGRTMAEAFARKDTWTVLVVDEVQVDGTTEQLATQLRAQAGEIPVWHDPHGAKGSAARGTANTSDAAMLEHVGHVAAPANGTRKGKPQQLDEIASRNVMHVLMAEFRYLVHERCTGVLDAMENDMRKPDGKMDKRASPDSETDFRSGYSDSTRYGVWPIFNNLVRHEPGKE